jgi:hypothetical protein
VNSGGKVAARAGEAAKMSELTNAKTDLKVEHWMEKARDIIPSSHHLHSTHSGNQAAAICSGGLPVAPKLREGG